MGRVVSFSRYGGPEVLEVRETAQPQPAENEVRVRVLAAGVNPIDCKLRRGDMRGIVPDTFPKTLGNEFAGIVDRIGAGASGFEPGDEVLGFASAAAYADLLTVPTTDLVRKPAAMPFLMAGTLSAAGQTAWHALEELGVQAGQTVLVHAAAGGVGSVFVQLARLRGAVVIGTASERNHAYLRELGATPVLYGPGLADRVRALAPDGVDAAFDAIGGDAVAISTELVADRGRIGTIVDQAAADRHGARRLRATRSARTLTELGGLWSAGKLRLTLSDVYPLERVADAHRACESGHVRGKLVLDLS
jgi:enoyl reductase